MTIPTHSVEDVRKFIQAHANRSLHPTDSLKLSMTIARDSGARGLALGRELKQYFEERWPKSPPWMVFESNLVDQILHDSRFPEYLAKHMKEDEASIIGEWVSNLLGGHPSDCELFEHTLFTMRRLLNMGHSIIVGRGANFVVRDMPHVFRLRLTVSEKIGIERVQEDENVSQKEAKRVKAERDRARKGYVRHYFSEDIENPDAYDLVINTDDKTLEEIKAIVLGKMLKNIEEI